MRIFIVENHGDTVAYLRKYLEATGHAVRAAGTIEDAVAALREEPTEVLLSDISLPDGDGWELLARLGTTGNAPVAIAMSGHTGPEFRRRSVEAGFRHYITKPFLPEELDAVLAGIASSR